MRNSFRAYSLPQIAYFASHPGSRGDSRSRVTLALLLALASLRLAVRICSRSGDPRFGDVRQIAERLTGIVEAGD